MRDRIHFGGFRVEARTLTLWRGSKRLDVTPKMVETLLVLLRRPGEIVDKQTILDEVWPGLHIAESGLTRNISVLRKALDEEAPGVEFIETLSKRGYRFVGSIETAKRRLHPAWGVAAALALLALSGRPGYRDDSGAAREPVLIGQALSQKHSPVAARQSLKWFAKAVEIEPASASARTGLADAKLQLAAFGIESTARDQALFEARQAVRLAPGSSEAHAVLGGALLMRNLDWKGSENALRTAVRLDARNLRALLGFAYLRVRQGRFAEAADFAAKARQVDPAAASVALIEGKVAYYAGDAAKAAGLLEAFLEREPDFGLAHYYLGLSYAYLHRFEEARRELRASRFREELLRHDLAWMDLRAGDAASAEKYQHSRKVRSLLLDAEAGDLKRAIPRAKELVARRSPDALAMISDPRLARLRSSADWPQIERLLLSY